ncbi:DUF3159 domain-containing protein, partial [Mycolicibacterium houstonense]
VPAIVAALVTAALVFGWQLVRRESVRPALWGFVGVAACALLALVTGQAKDFYLPGIWMSLASAVAMTLSILVRRPLVGVIWAWATGRDGSWRRVPGVRWVFTAVTAVLATVSWSRFLIQNYLYDTDQDALLAVARLVMGWPLFVVTTTLVLLSARYAIRALPQSAN